MYADGSAAAQPPASPAKKPPNAPLSRPINLPQNLPTLPDCQLQNGSGRDVTKLRFLQAGELESKFDGVKVCMASYPRSGNSLLRGLMEEVSGIYTGCDSRPDRTLSRSLREFGLMGEGLVDASVWVIKTHFPERSGWKPFSAQRVVLLIRNPWCVAAADSTVP
jgi:hypothetical protein